MANTPAIAINETAYLAGVPAMILCSSIAAAFDIRPHGTCACRVRPDLADQMYIPYFRKVMLRLRSAVTFLFY